MKKHGMWAGLLGLNALVGVLLLGQPALGSEPSRCSLSKASKGRIQIGKSTDTCLTRLAAIEVNGTTLQPYELEDGTVVLTRDGHDKIILPFTEEYRRLMSKERLFQIGISAGYLNLPREAFFTTIGDARGEFGDVFDGSPTRIYNHSLVFNLSLGFRPKFLLPGAIVRIETQSSLIGGPDSRGGVVTVRDEEIITGERRSFLKTGDADAIKLLLSQWNFTLEQDVIVLPAFERSLAFAVGFFIGRYKTENWAGNVQQQDGDGFRDQGMSVTARLFESGDKNSSRMPIHYFTTLKWGSAGLRNLNVGMFLPF